MDGRRREDALARLPINSLTPAGRNAECAQCPLIARPIQGLEVRFIVRRDLWHHNAQACFSGNRIRLVALRSEYVQ